MCSVVSIVKEVNRLFDTALTPILIRRRVKNGLSSIPPRQGGGRKPSLPIQIEAAIVNTISKYTNLAYAEMKKTPDRVTVVKMLSLCLKGGLTTLKDFESLYKQLYPSVVINVSITTGSSTLENR